jgi:hypothetical protein
MKGKLRGLFDDKLFKNAFIHLANRRRKGIWKTKSEQYEDSQVSTTSQKQREGRVSEREED